MKTFFPTAVYSLLLLLPAGLFSCKGKKQEVVWETLAIERPAGAREEDEIDIGYPLAVDGKAAEKINAEIEETLASFFGWPGVPVSAAVDSILGERNREPMLRDLRYSMDSRGEVFSCGNIGSVVLNVYQYLGGAHGLQAVLVCNFDLTTGRRIAWKEMISDTTALAQINREVFLETHRNEPGYVESLFASADRLPLPENAAVGPDGVHIFYNPYEIAPYSWGGTEYLIPMAETDPLLNRALLSGKKR